MTSCRVYSVSDDIVQTTEKAALSELSGGDQQGLSGQ